MDQRIETLQGQRVHLPGHFDGTVTVEAMRPLGQGWEIRVRLPTGAPDFGEPQQNDVAHGELVAHRPFRGDSSRYHSDRSSRYSITGIMRQDSGIRNYLKAHVTIDVGTV